MEAFLALGSNVGNRLKNLKTALTHIKKLINTKVLNISKVYETKPFDVLDKQEYYLNCCVKLQTEFSPEVLLGCLLGIEAAMGRTRPFYHAARIIDIDLLLYENIKVNTKDLILPHPEILKRAFVMVPLFDIYNEEYNFKFIDKLKITDKAGVNVFGEGINLE